MVVRTCIGCRQQGDAANLMRFVLDSDGTVIWDEFKKLPGRGAHLHPASRCWELADRRRAFTRALRAKGRVDTRTIAELATTWQ